MRKERGRPSGHLQVITPDEQPSDTTEGRGVLHSVHYVHLDRKRGRTFRPYPYARASYLAVAVITFYFAYVVGRAAPHAPNLALAILGALFVWVLLSFAFAALWACVFGGRR